MALHVPHLKVSAHSAIATSSAIKLHVANMKNTDYFRYAITCYAVSKDEWDTKETSKFMKNALYILQKKKKRRTPLGQK